MTRTDMFGVEVRERLMWDIREGVVGSETFVPKHAIIATWKNVSFAGGIDNSLYKVWWYWNYFFRHIGMLSFLSEWCRFYNRIRKKKVKNKIKNVNNEESRTSNCCCVFSSVNVNMVFFRQILSKWLLLLMKCIPTLFLTTKIFNGHPIRKLAEIPLGAKEEFPHS